MEGGKWVWVGAMAGKQKKNKKEGKGGRVRRFFHRGASSHPSEGESLGCSMTVPCSFK